MSSPLDDPDVDSATMMVIAVEVGHEFDYYEGPTLPSGRPSGAWIVRTVLTALRSNGYRVVKGDE